MQHSSNNDAWQYSNTAAQRRTSAQQQRGSIAAQQEHSNTAAQRCNSAPVKLRLSATLQSDTWGNMWSKHSNGDTWSVDWAIAQNLTCVGALGHAQWVLCDNALHVWNKRGMRTTSGDKKVACSETGKCLKPKVTTWKHILWLHKPHVCWCAGTRSASALQQRIACVQQARHAKDLVTEKLHAVRRENASRQKWSWGKMECDLRCCANPTCVGALGHAPLRSRAQQELRFSHRYRLQTTLHMMPHSVLWCACVFLCRHLFWARDNKTQYFYKRIADSCRSCHPLSDTYILCTVICGSRWATWWILSVFCGNASKHAQGRLFFSKRRRVHMTVAQWKERN